MLVVTAFTFFGLSALQNISFFTNLLDGKAISINITAEEEENEASNNEEVKEVMEKLDFREDFRNFLKRANSTHSLAFQDHSLILHNGYLEVVTPPPQV